ncbi:FG-GAP-like repeat-containing protein [bacterium]|nr:FG-GAP-like repeat-containing protein [bacterium]
MNSLSQRMAGRHTDRIIDCLMGRTRYFLLVLLFISATSGCDQVDESDSLDAPIQVGVQNELEDTEQDVTSDNLPTIDFEALEKKTRSAEALAASGQYAKAAELAIEIAREPIQDPVAPLIKAFDWYLRAADLGLAEETCRLAVEMIPEDARAHRALAQLLNAEGRRYEASQQVMELIRLGAVLPREVLSLIDLNGPFELVSFAEVVGKQRGTLLDLGLARRRLVADGKPDEALALLAGISSSRNVPNVAALRGRILAEQVDLDGLIDWGIRLPEGVETSPEYWLAIGLWCVHLDLDREAVAAFTEVITKDPTNRRSLRALSAALGRMGETELSKKVQSNLGVLDSIFRDASTANAEQSMQIANQLQQLQRLWESVVWYRQSFEMAGVLEQKADEINQRVEIIRQWEDSKDPVELSRLRVQQTLGLKIEDYPVANVPDLVMLAREKLAIRHPKSESDLDTEALSFEDVAVSLGVKTDFTSDYKMETVDFWLYQANGGGLGVCDFDLDGASDLYVVQSGGDPRVSDSSKPNQFFRNLDGGAFSEVTGFSGTADQGYGQGVCAADVNQDGWVDLLVANIGRNALYLNQGDGTFRNASEIVADDVSSWTSSLALGDLDGDHLPEMIEINYLDDPQIFERKCVGKNLECTPQRFRAAVDRIYSTQGDGVYHAWSGAASMKEVPNYGFGAILTNFDDQNGNDLFVSNDGDVNHFWRSGASSGNDAGSNQGRYKLSEAGAISGCSIGINGLSQACMGITSGDFDRNGKIDLMITNFHNEPMNLFLQTSAGIFVDEALKYGLSQPSRNVLGFGVQAGDFDNDGWLDAAVANGHLYDARYADIPFQMQSQLFRGAQEGFLLQDQSSAGAYWQREHLGRTVAILDFNQDGRLDLVANHLDQPVAILENRSNSKNWFQLELVGTVSERDAVGATVTIRCGEESWSAWQTAGDGYMCTNESVIHLGVGEVGVIDHLEVIWPAGKKQTFSNVEVNHRYLLTEGDELYSR